MIYEVLTVMVLILGLFSIQKYNFDYKKFFVTIIGIAMFIFMAFRSSRVGTDTLGYINSFKKASRFSFSNTIEIFKEKEPFYNLFESIVRTFTDNYTVFFIIISIFVMLSVCRFIYKYSSNPTMSFIAYMSMAYFAFNLAGIRQTIAIGLLLYAMDAMLEKKTLKALVLVGVASLFHISSLIGIFIIIIYFLPLNFFYVAVCTAASIFMYVSGNTFWKKVVEIVWSDERRYKEEFGGTSTLVLLILIVVGVAFIAPVLFTNKHKIKKLSDEEQSFISINSYFYKILLFSIPFQVLAIHQANAFRVAMIFHIVMLALLPNSVTALKKQSERALINCVLIICLLVQLFVFTYVVADINPYTFFWQV